MDASDDVIIKRYKETRRSHPLAEECDSLEGAIALERRMLAPLRERAEFVVDTSDLSTAKLRGELLRLFGRGEPGGGYDGERHLLRLQARTAPRGGSGL